MPGVANPVLGIPPNPMRGIMPIDGAIIGIALVAAERDRRTMAVTGSATMAVRPSTLPALCRELLGLYLTILPRMFDGCDCSCIIASAAGVSILLCPAFI